VSLRVIGGVARGKRLKAAPGHGTRPIMDRVKEALFNIIGAGVRGASFLDLFAGTGSVGIEALSRGAEHALFVELSRESIKTIHSNLKHTQLSSGATVMRRDAYAILAKAPERHFHYIYVAPPQYKKMWLRTLEALDANSAWQRPNSRVIVQIDPDEFEAERQFKFLRVVDTRRYGRTLLVFYEFQTDGAACRPS